MEKINLRERKRARQLVLQALYQWQIAYHDLKEIEVEFLTNKKNKKFDKDYFTEVLYQVPNKIKELDESLRPHIDRTIDEVSPIELVILRMGIYEMLNRIDIPYRVVINEAVELAKTYGAMESHRYINGVLDKAAKTIRAVEMKQ